MAREEFYLFSKAGRERGDHPERMHNTMHAHTDTHCERITVKYIKKTENTVLRDTWLHTQELSPPQSHTHIHTQYQTHTERHTTAGHKTTQFNHDDTSDRVRDCVSVHISVTSGPDSQTFTYVKGRPYFLAMSSMAS